MGEGVRDHSLKESNRVQGISDCHNRATLSNAVAAMGQVSEESATECRKLWQQHVMSCGKAQTS